MTSLSNLIAKLEAAKEGSRELDLDIICMLHPTVDREAQARLMPEGSWRYTTSLDAALTLVPADRNTILKIYEPGEHVAFCLPKNGSRSETWTKAATPPLALCIAALKAREARR